MKRYQRTNSFTQDQAENPAYPFKGWNLDAELGAIEESLGGLHDNHEHLLKEVKRVSERPYELTSPDKLYFNSIGKSLQEIIEESEANSLMANSKAQSAAISAMAAANSMTNGIAAHVAEADPHAQYLRQTEADALYDASGAAAAAQAASQPVDSDLTAIAALTTTAFGRSFLELANAAAGRTLLALGTAATANTGDFDAAGAAAAAQAASQPVDSDLTAIAALTTTAYGRSVLELANAAAARTLFDVQQADAELSALAGLTSAADKVPYFTGSGAAATADLTSVARTLIAQTTQANMRSTGLGLGSISTLNSIATGNIDNDAVTYAKIQNVSATSRILGRKTAAAGDTEECTLSEILDFIGSAAHGDILYRGASSWARLGAGTSGQFLKTQGAGANPVWADVSGDVVRISEQTASNSANISFTGLDNSTYREHVLRITNLIAASANADILLTLSSDNGSSYLSSGYIYSHSYTKNSVVTGVSSTAGSNIPLTATANSTGNEYFVEIVLPRLATAKSMIAMIRSMSPDGGTPVPIDFHGSGGLATQTAINALRIAMSTGNITSGNFTLYGVK